MVEITLYNDEWSAAVMKGATRSLFNLLFAAADSTV